MEKNIQNDHQYNQRSFALKVIGVFALSIILICGLIFIFQYDIAYDDNTGGGFLPPSFAVVFYYFLLSVAAVFASVILKIAFKNRVRFSMLFLSSVVLPILCYHFNFRAFDKDGFLYPLMDQGGLFHFIAIGDYNFDGMNDELYHTLYDEREYSSQYAGHYDDTVIDYIETNAVGTGSGLSGCFCFYDWEERVIQLFLDEDSVSLKQVEIKIAFQDTSAVQHVSFSLDNSKLNHTVNKNNTVSIVLDADACLKLQKRLAGDERYIPIQYEVGE